MVENSTNMKETEMNKEKIIFTLTFLNIIFFHIFIPYFSFCSASEF